MNIPASTVVANKSAKKKNKWLYISAVLFLSTLPFNYAVAEQNIGSLKTEVITNYTYPTCSINGPTNHYLGERMPGGENPVGGDKKYTLNIVCTDQVPTTVFGEVVKGHAFSSWRGPAVSFLDSRDNDSNGDIYAIFKLGKGFWLNMDGIQGFCEGSDSRKCEIDFNIGANVKTAPIFGMATAAVKFTLKYD
ncbi:hypothetical protein WN774_004582 [Salmonella enterica subsp. enterica serovar Bredeney]